MVIPEGVRTDMPRNQFVRAMVKSGMYDIEAAEYVWEVLNGEHPEDEVD